jgi:excisionase family DNA binding protein
VPKTEGQTESEPVVNRLERSAAAARSRLRHRRDGDTNPCTVPTSNGDDVQLATNERGTTMTAAEDRVQALERLREELILGGRRQELEALDQILAEAKAAARTESPKRKKQPAGKTYLKLKKKYYTPAEVAKRVGVSRQTVVKWIERGELEAESTPGGHHRIPASVFHREGRGDVVQMIPLDDD